jgi:hypothetical protein
MSPSQWPRRRWFRALLAGSRVISWLALVAVISSINIGRLQSCREHCLMVPQQVQNHIQW